VLNIPSHIKHILTLYRMQYKRDHQQRVHTAAIHKIASIVDNHLGNDMNLQAVGLLQLTHSLP